jgi:hypothetical protein
MKFIIGVVLILLVIWYLNINPVNQIKSLLGFSTEGYRSCRDCTGYSMSKSGTTVINPFVWPYSGTSCVDDLYIKNKDVGLDLGFTLAPISPNTPDHVPPTN